MKNLRYKVAFLFFVWGWVGGNYLKECPQSFREPEMRRRPCNVAEKVSHIRHAMPYMSALLYVVFMYE